jgi:hypothetical protein
VVMLSTTCQGRWHPKCVYLLCTFIFVLKNEKFAADERVKLIKDFTGANKKHWPKGSAGTVIRPWVSGRGNQYVRQVINKIIAKKRLTNSFFRHTLMELSSTMGPQNWVFQRPVYRRNKEG